MKINNRAMSSKHVKIQQLNACNQKELSNDPCTGKMIMRHLNLIRLVLLALFLLY